MVWPQSYSYEWSNIKRNSFTRCIYSAAYGLGKCWSSSSTVVIRGLSTQKLKSLGAIKAVVKEAITGALLGLLMMLVVFPFAWWQGEGPLIASAVGISLISLRLPSWQVQSSLCCLTEWSWSCFNVLPFHYNSHWYCRRIYLSKYCKMAIKHFIY